VRRRAGGDHNDNAPNYGYDGSTATYYWRANDDNNHTRGHRRLLIAKAGRGCTGIGLWELSSQLAVSELQPATGRWLQS